MDRAYTGELSSLNSCMRAPLVLVTDPLVLVTDPRVLATRRAVGEHHRMAREYDCNLAAMDMRAAAGRGRRDRHSGAWRRPREIASWGLVVGDVCRRRRVVDPHGAHVRLRREGHRRSVSIRPSEASPPLGRCEGAACVLDAN